MCGESLADALFCVIRHPGNQEMEGRLVLAASVYRAETECVGHTDCRVLSTRHIKARDHLVVCSAEEPLSVQRCSSSNFSCIISCLLPEPLKAVCHKAALLSLLLMCS